MGEGKFSALNKMGQHKSKENNNNERVVLLLGLNKTPFLETFSLNGFKIVESQEDKCDAIILIVESTFDEEEMLESKNILLSNCLARPGIPVYVIETGKKQGQHYALLQLEALKRKWSELRALDYDKPEWRYRVQRMITSPL